MARTNSPFVAFNRGIISPLAMARVDLDRSRLSAEVFENFIPATQGSMSLRPGTKYMGSSRSDSGAEWLEFVASTDDVALLEITNGTMRVWLGEDAHALELLSRPPVSTTLSITDTGWVNASIGGAIASAEAVDLIPKMSGFITNGVAITASSSQALDGSPAWRVGDDNLNRFWQDTGAFEGGTLPSWLKVDFGAGNTKTVALYTIRAPDFAGGLDNVPRSWDFQGNDVDTGDGWTTLDTGGDQTGWGVAEKRTFTVGSPQAFRFYRWNIKEVAGGGDGSGEVVVAEVELFDESAENQVIWNSAGITLNAAGAASIARAPRLQASDPVVQRAPKLRTDFNGTLETVPRTISHALGLSGLQPCMTTTEGKPNG